MKYCKTPFRFDDDKIKFLYKNSEYDIFEKAQKLRFVNLRFSASDKLNVIGISPALFSEFHSQKMLLINSDTGKYINVSIKPYSNISDAEFVATSYLKEILDLETSENVFLCQYKDFKFKQIYPQKIDHIRESDLVISESDYNNLHCDIQESPCKFFELYNTSSHDSIDPLLPELSDSAENNGFA